MAKWFGQSPYQSPDTDGGAQSSLNNLIGMTADHLLFAKLKTKVAKAVVTFLIKLLFLLLKIILIIFVVLLSISIIVLIICMMIKGPALVFSETMAALSTISSGTYFDEETAQHRVETFDDADFSDKEWYYTYDEETGEMMFRYIDSEGVIQEKTQDEFFVEAYAVWMLFKDKTIDGSDSDMVLLDDSDMEKIFDQIIEAEKKRKESAKKKYQWIYKTYDYIYSEEEVYDEELGWVTETVKSDTPEWQPDDVWDDSHMYHWYDDWAEVELYRKDIEGEMDTYSYVKETETGQQVATTIESPRFMVHWQSVLTACQMVSTANYDNWNETGDEVTGDLKSIEYGDIDGYYLTNETVTKVVEAFDYDFEFYYDGSEYERTYRYSEMEDIAYRLDIRYMDEVSSAPDTAYIIKTPATAPKKISNLYETYIYIYEPVEENFGNMTCVGRTKNVDAVAFVDFMKSFCPEFDFDEFIEIVESYPSSYGEVQKFKKLKSIYEWQLETGYPYFTEEYRFPCFSNGVIIGSNVDVKDDDGTIPPYWGEIPGDNDYLGDYDYVYVSNGWYAISEAARKDLTQSDNLSREQIYKMLEWFSLKYGNPEGCKLTDATDAVYNWQQSDGGSVLAVFGIFMQEGAMTTQNGLKHWNFGNFTAASGDISFKSNPNSKYNWADFRAMYSDVGTAIVEQLTRISRDYWRRGQNSLFSMSWKTIGGVYNAQTPEEAAIQDHPSYFSHCYCPYWEDSAFKVTQEKVPNPAYGGWSNKCALYMESLRCIVGG